MKIPDFKSTKNSDHQLGDLPSVTVTPSRCWLTLQLVLNLGFVNLGCFALLPYFLSNSWYLSFTGFLFWLGTNFISVVFFSNKKHQKKTPSQISVKNSIWLIEYQNQRFYCELAADIVCWQWIIIIPLYCPQRQKILRIILLNDSLHAKDNAKIRRWIYSHLN